MDHWLSRPGQDHCNILCTQPRRLSATAVAQRVANERTEKLGGSVGYQIRLESVMVGYRIGHVTWWPLVELLYRDHLIIVKSLQCIWRSDTHRWNIWVPDLHVSCSDLTWTSVKVFRLQMQFSCSQIQLEAFNGSFAIHPSFEIPLKMSHTLKDRIFVQRWKFKSSRIYELVWILETHPGGRLNIKMPSYQYRDSHVKDKTVSLTVLSLTWESPYLGKTVFILRRGPGHLSARLW